jgi:circadian clock protein KaiB
VLYINGSSDLSRRAVEAAHAFCEATLPGRYDLKVLDLETHAVRATEDGVLATPTLVLIGTEPPRRFTGDLSRVDRIVDAFGLVPAAASSARPRSADPG